MAVRPGNLTQVPMRAGQPSPNAWAQQMDRGGLCVHLQAHCMRGAGKLVVLSPHWHSRPCTAHMHTRASSEISATDSGWGRCVMYAYELHPSRAVSFVALSACRLVRSSPASYDEATAEELWEKAGAAAGRVKEMGKEMLVG